MAGPESLRCVAQTFLSAGLGDFPVARFKASRFNFKDGVKMRPRDWAGIKGG